MDGKSSPRLWALSMAVLVVLLPQGSAVVWSQESTPPAQRVNESLKLEPGMVSGDGKDESDESDESGETDEANSLQSAQHTLKTFVVAMERKDYRLATSTLDFSVIEPSPDSFAQVVFAQRLKTCIERLGLLDASQVSDEFNGPPVHLPPGEIVSPIVIGRSDNGQWQFTSATVANIDHLFQTVKDAPPAVKATPDTATPAADAGATDLPASDSTKAEDEGGSAVAEPVVPDGLKSARRTMRSFLESLESKENAMAVAALDFSKVTTPDSELGLFRKLWYASRLKDIVVRLAAVDYAMISDDPLAPVFLFPPDQDYQPIEISRDNTGLWQFSADTVAHIDALHKVYKDKPVLTLSEAEKNWYDRELFMGNATWRILALFAAIFVSLLIGQLLRALFRWRAGVHEVRNRPLNEIVYRTLAKTSVGVLFLVGLNAGIKMLVIDNEIETLVNVSIHVIFTVVIGYIAFRLVDVAVEMLRQLADRTGSTLNNMLVPIVSASLRVTIVVVVGLEIALAISDQPPSTVLAGLGAGGLAIGLAAQDTIKNLFGSVMIFADRPFELGDRIVFDGHDGPVESVGFRSTRIRTLDGHLITIPNGEMAHRTIHNIGKRPYIRRVVNIHVSSDTSSEKLQRALAILRELLVDHDGMREELPPRVFLDDFLDSAINIRAIYWFHPPNYWDFVAFGERLNLQIVERLNAEGIRYALPSEQLFITDDVTRVARK